MEQRQPSYTVGGNINWYNHYGEHWRFLKKLNIEVPYDPAVSLLDLYLKKQKH